MSRPRLLDLFCCAGGAAMGYHRAGFDVTGVDISPQPRYPFPFVQGDALTYLAEHGREYDVIHASPPCQGYSVTRSITHSAAPLLVGAVRGLLIDTGRPYVIENVMGSPLLNPIVLCGTMFGLRLFRHRLFESNLALLQERHATHPADTSGYIKAYVNLNSYAAAAPAFGIDWPMTRRELRQAIPPAYTEYVGRQLL